MKLGLHIIGNTSAFDTVNAAFAGTHLNRGNGLLSRVGIETSVTFAPDLTSAREIANKHDGFQIIVVDARDTASLARLADMRQNGGLNAPIIAIAPADATLPFMAQYCRVVADWLFPDFAPSELAFRVLAIVTAAQRTVHRLPCGEMTLSPESRNLTLNGRSVRLSPSEVALAEFFLNKSGQVIALPELVGFFEATGKSSAMNNIRVAIYQLRLKLEELSNNQLTIVTLYRQGYALRQMRPKFRISAPVRQDEIEAVA